MDKLHSKLGKKLSNRYLGSDAFTSSAGRFGGRTVSRLGSILKPGASKKYYGVGQRVGLFEFKNIVLKILTGIVLLCILAYTIPVFRYGTHSFFTRTFALTAPVDAERKSNNALLSDEAYVAPRLFQTDEFVGRQPIGTTYTVGTFVYDTESDTLIGTVSSASTSTFGVVLFSDSGLKGNFFTLSESFIDMSEVAQVSASGTEAGDVSTTTSAPAVQKTGAQPIAFEGVGYGQLLAKIPPQTKIESGTKIFVSTPDGLKPVALISHVEPDSGSSFTLVYAQLLIPPTHIYKVRLVPLSNE